MEINRKAVRKDHKYLIADIRGRGFVPPLEACQMFDLPIGTLRSWIKRGGIRSIRIGRSVFVHANEVMSAQDGIDERRQRVKSASEARDDAHLIRGLDLGTAKPMGRPLKGEVAATERVTVRCTPNEAEAWKRRAGSKGLSEWIRGELEETRAVDRALALINELSLSRSEAQELVKQCFRDVLREVGLTS